MILLRCAWHSKYHGYGKLYGVTSWRGLGISVSDGMCGSCSRRWRTEFFGDAGGAAAEAFERDDVPPLIPRWVPRAALAASLLAAVTLAARPVNLPLDRPPLIAERTSDEGVLALPAEPPQSVVAKPDVAKPGVASTDPRSRTAHRVARTAPRQHVAATTARRPARQPVHDISRLWGARATVYLLQPPAHDHSAELQAP